MLGTLSQNINAFNDPPIAPRWVPWNDDFWTTDSGFNEKIPYNFRVPQSAGVTDQVRDTLCKILLHLPTVAG